MPREVHRKGLHKCPKLAEEIDALRAKARQRLAAFGDLLGQTPADVDRMVLNNFHTRFPGGHQRVQLSAEDLMDTRVADVLVNRGLNPGGKSVLHLGGTYGQFFTDIEKALAIAGIHPATLDQFGRTPPRVLYAHLAESWATYHEPVTTAYAILRAKGYTHRELTD